MSQDTLLVSTQPPVDVLAVVQRIKEEIHRKRTDPDEATIKRELVSAIRHYRGRRFFFNLERFVFYTTADQGDYGEESSIRVRDGYPADMLRPDTVQLYIGTTAYPPMRKLPIAKLRDLQTSTTNSSGIPGEYAFYAKRFWLYPAPSTDGWQVKVDYIKNIGTPYYAYTGGTWSFFDEGGADLSNDWTSPWLDHAEELIRSRVKRKIYQHTIYDKERAEEMRDAEEEALAALRADTDNYHFVSEPVAWGV